MNGRRVRRARYAEPWRTVKFNRSMKDVFNFVESSDSSRASSNRHPEPITNLVPTFTTRFCLISLMTWAWTQQTELSDNSIYFPGCQSSSLARTPS